MEGVYLIFDGLTSGEFDDSRVLLEPHLVDLVRIVSMKLALYETAPGRALMTFQRPPIVTTSHVKFLKTAGEQEGTFVSCCSQVRRLKLTYDCVFGH